MRHRSLHRSRPRRGRVRHELPLQPRPHVERGAAEEGEHGAVLRKGLGDVAADDAGGSDDGAVFACEGEGGHGF